MVSTWQDAVDTSSGNACRVPTTRPDACMLAVIILKRLLFLCGNRMVTENEPTIGGRGWGRICESDVVEEKIFKHWVVYKASPWSRFGQQMRFSASVLSSLTRDHCEGNSVVMQHVRQLLHPRGRIQVVPRSALQQGPRVSHLLSPFLILLQNVYKPWS